MAKAKTSKTFICTPEKEDRVVKGQIVQLNLQCINDDNYYLHGGIIKLDSVSDVHQVEIIPKDDKIQRPINLPGNVANIYLDTSGMNTGPYRGKVTVNNGNISNPPDGEADFFLLIEPPDVDRNNIQVGLQRTTEPLSDHLILWSMIDYTSRAISFNGIGTNSTLFKFTPRSKAKLIKENLPNSVIDINKLENRLGKNVYTETQLKEEIFTELNVDDLAQKEWFRDRVFSTFEGQTDGYKQYIDEVLCYTDGDIIGGVDSYEQLVKYTKQFLIDKVGSVYDINNIRDVNKKDASIKKLQSSLDKRFSGRIEKDFVAKKISDYFIKSNGQDLFPYYYTVNSRLSINGEAGCADPIQEKLSKPLLIELIWSYWQEENMLNQALQVISLRFQNRLIPGKGNALSNLAIDPLRRINNLIWGYIQNESDRLSVSRRSHEYDHQYGLRLYGKAVGEMQPVESRSRFLEAFHNLLHVATRYFKEFDDTTIYADPFPLRNALREVHLILSEGSHNQYGDLPWTSRVEMLSQQYILARPEMREFLGGRIMVPYTEPWMDRLDTVKKMMGWGDTSSTHYRDLAFWGERLLLSIRFDNWNDSNILPQDAANWADFWRNDIQGYIHSYRSVTGVDLSGDQVDYTMPALLLAKRLNGKPYTSGEPKPQAKLSSNGQNGKVNKEIYPQHYNPI